MITIEDLKEKFINIFNKKPEKIFFAPGRINFIGEHIDYNGGKVLPFAIDKGIYAVVTFKERKENTIIHLYSEIDNNLYTVDLDKNRDSIQQSSLWIRYPVGVMDALRKNQNFEMWIYYYSNLPAGSGLSSSAAIEVVTGYLLKSYVFEETSIDTIDLALLCQKVENEFVGVQCGIMDQFVVANGKENHLILLDTHTLNYEYLYFFYPEIQIVVINSNVPRSLASSKYNERRKECQLALQTLQTITKQSFLNLVEVPENLVLELKEENLKKRALHVIRENQRVKEMVQLLKHNPKDSISKIGHLLYDSHQSLKELYEVSCQELDIIIEISQKFDGVIGARMTGAGFGGCALALLKKEFYETYTNQLLELYTKKTHLELQIFTTNISDGVKEWK